MYQPAISVVSPAGWPRPITAAGISRPMATLRVLLFMAVLKDAAPRPRAARYTAATALGRLVTAASTRPPTINSGTANRVPSADAARSIATLATITTSNDPAATATSFRLAGRGRMASPSSSSSSATADCSQLTHPWGNGRRPSPARAAQD